jgi:hypothetical protein
MRASGTKPAALAFLMSGSLPDRIEERLPARRAYSPSNGGAHVEHKHDLFWRRDGAISSMAADLRLAHAYMDRLDGTADPGIARDCYEKALAGHDSVDRVLKRHLPASGAARQEFGSGLVRLRARLRAYENATR